MRILTIVLVLLPLTSLASEVCVAVGMNREEAIALIKRHSGTDITPGLEVVGPKGERPLAGIYWEFRDYDAIITLSTRDGKVVEITYWTKKDFSRSKDHRANSEQRIQSLKIDTKTRAVSIEKIEPEKKAG